METYLKWVEGMSKWITLARHKRYPCKIDNWLAPNTTIQSLIQGPLNRNEDNLNISTVLHLNNSQPTHLSFDLPINIADGIKSTYIPLYAITLDRIVWGLNSTGNFTVNVCYKVLTQSHQGENNHGWIWRIHIMPKIKIFVWLIIHNRLPTKSY